MSAQVVELSSYADLLEVTDGNPVVRYNHHPSVFRRAWAVNRGPTATAAWTADTSHRGRTITAIGVPEDAAALVAAVLDAEPGAGHLTVPAGTVPRLPFAVGTGRDWDWFWTTTPPSTRPGEAAVVDLDVTDPVIKEQVARLLDTAAPGASARPDDPGAARWSGIWAPAGDDDILAACAARRERVPGVTNLGSITTHPDHRARGLAGDITAATTRHELERGARAVTLGMYADNDVARRVYEKVGFAVGQAFSSRSLR